MKQKIILFGVNGQLGSLISAVSPMSVELHSFGSADIDITNLKGLASVLEEINPSVIINSAAYTQVDKAEEGNEEAYAVNSLGSENIARASSDGTRIIHISTDFVFDENKRTPYTTEDETKPLSVYGKSKLKGEQSLLRPAPLRATIIRTAWLYSAEGKNFMNSMLFLMENKEELSVVGDQRGIPISAHTLAEAIWRFVQKAPRPGVYHWSDSESVGEELSWYGFACEIQLQAIKLGLLQKSIPIKSIPTEAYPTPAKRPLYSVLDNTKAWDALGCVGKNWKELLTEVLNVKR